jgi:putative tricarboxylic transport membrane protein
MRPKGARLVSALVALMLLPSVPGCARPPEAERQLGGLRIMVPNRPGSGYDVTARTAAKAISDARILRDVEVFNLPGADGTVGLQRLVYEKGNDKLLMLMGLGLVGAQYTHQTRATLQQTTPIARLIEEPDVVVVTRDSPYHSLRDLVTAWRRNPAAVSVGGGSLPGGPDFLAARLLAKAAGIPIRQTRYVRYDGGGALLAAVLGREVSFGVSGVAETYDQIASGQLRVLAVTSEKRVSGIAAPTLRESGVDVVFTNWRGIVAPPDLPESQVMLLRQVVERMHASGQWRAALARNGWTDAYLAGDEFGRFLRDATDQIGGVLADLGIATSG